MTWLDVGLDWDAISSRDPLLWSPEKGNRPYLVLVQNIPSFRKVHFARKKHLSRVKATMEYKKNSGQLCVNQEGGKHRNGN